MTPEAYEVKDSSRAATAGADFPGYAGQVLNVKLQDPTGNRLLSRPEYCELLGISVSTSERWGQIGFGPRPVKIGLRRIGYRLAEVLAFIEARQNVAA